MKLETIELGRIVNAHGIRGHLRIQATNASAELIVQTKVFYIDGVAVKPTASQIHKHLVLMKLPGVEDMNQALTYKNKSLMAKRADLNLPEDFCFDQELVGMDVFDEENQPLGKVVLVEEYPASKIYTIRGAREYLVPGVPDVFIKSVDLETNRMVIHVMEGLATDEN